MHKTTLPIAILGFTEFPITPVKPSHYKFIDLDALIHSVVPTYHP